MGSRVSKKSEIKLDGVALASLAELKTDYEDFLRQHGLPLWDKNSAKAREIRALAYKSYKSYETYRTYMAEAETAANCALCLINQATFLLTHQIAAAEAAFLKEGGYTENLYQKRVAARRDPGPDREQQEKEWIAKLREAVAAGKPLPPDLPPEV